MGLEMSRAQAQAHANKHGYRLDEPGRVRTADNSSERAGEALRKPVLPKSRMNKTETEFSLILEAMKRKGEIQDWRFEGVSLAWGANPVTGKPMRYTPDFFVQVEDSDGRKFYRCLEIKGPHIREKDRIRFRGCRACWPAFTFEMHQRSAGQWRRIE